jgi:Uncharacterized phage-associated protein
MNNKFTFCENCRKDVAYFTKQNTATQFFKGDNVDFVETLAICEICESEVFVSDLHDDNLRSLYDTYREKNDIISLEHICEIPIKYAIGKRPLSSLLGWGELTFTRYCDGDMPTKQYADILKRVYNEPSYFLSILNERKEFISAAAYNKSNDATQKLIGMRMNSESKLDCVVRYILKQCNDITNLALQKSLYYIQGFYYAFHNTFLFEEDCEAWVHGPVYKTVYQKYSYDKSDLINNKNEIDFSCFTIDEKTLIDSIIKYFCCYSGKTLESFTHIETPWLKTRGGLFFYEHSNRIIDRALISGYFAKVKDKYNMLNSADIKSYSTEMFENI